MEPIKDIEILRYCAGRHDCSKCKRMAYKANAANTFRYCSEYISRAALMAIGTLTSNLEDVYNHVQNKSDLCKICIFRGRGCDRKDGRCQGEHLFRFDLEKAMDINEIVRKLGDDTNEQCELDR